MVSPTDIACRSYTLLLEARGDPTQVPGVGVCGRKFGASARNSPDPLSEPKQVIVAVSHEARVTLDFEQ